MSNKNISAVILAAGRGDRIKSTNSKVLLNVSGKPILIWTLELLTDLGIKDIIVVVGYKAESVKKIVKKYGFTSKFAFQKKLLGTAKAIQLGIKKMEKKSNDLLILYGDDSSLYKSEIIVKLIKHHVNKSIKGTLLVVRSNTPTTLGGLKRDSKGRLIGVMGKKEMVINKIKQNEILCGAMCFDGRWLEKNINLIKKNPKSGEYPFPEIIKIAAKKRQFLETVVLQDQNQWNSMNFWGDYKQTKLKKELNLWKMKRR